MGQDLYANPLGTDGFEFVEFTSPDPRAGGSYLYLVDRYGAREIYDVDFVAMPGGVDHEAVGGEGNFKALFESLELDQIRRGVLSAEKDARRTS